MGASAVPTEFIMELVHAETLLLPLFQVKCAEWGGGKTLLPQIFPAPGLPISSEVKVREIQQVIWKHTVFVPPPVWPGGGSKGLER